MPQRAVSPYERVLGEHLGTLHPRLSAYFSAVPPGMVGVGHGVFDVVGTPRRWLWPVLAVLARDGIVFPVWERGVPFTVRNIPTGRGTLTAQREFAFARGHRTMVDEISGDTGELVDRLGRSGRLVAGFDATVDAGTLRLSSTRVAFVFAGREWRIPTALAPRVDLVEQFDDAAEQQRVSLRLEHPLLGRLYEYAGSFTYEFRPGEQGR